LPEKFGLARALRTSMWVSHSVSNPKSVHRSKSPASSGLFYLRRSVLF
jgi:hypothetical protein